MKLISLFLAAMAFSSFAHAEVNCVATIKRAGAIQTAKLVPAGPGFGYYGVTIEDFRFTVHDQTKYLLATITKGLSNEAHEVLVIGELSDTRVSQLQLVFGGANTAISCNL